jgi:hypothetical protein
VEYFAGNMRAQVKEVIAKPRAGYRNEVRAMLRRLRSNGDGVVIAA